MPSTAPSHPAGRAAKSPRGPAGQHPAARGIARRLPTVPEELAAGFVRLFLEVEAGLRPRRHVSALMCPVLVVRMAGTWVRPGPPGVLVRLEGSEPAAGVYEAVAVVRRGSRYGAIGLRLARRGGGWRVEDLVRPELGRLRRVPPVALDKEEDCCSRRSGHRALPPPPG